MIYNFFYFVLDVMRILKNRNYFSKKRIKGLSANRKLRILGNGSSLNNVNFDNEGLEDYMVVNRHVLSDNYVLVKPLYYVLADPHFFHHSEGLEILQKINEKTNWRMTLCIPFSREVKRQILMTIKPPCRGSGPQSGSGWADRGPRRTPPPGTWRSRARAAACRS